MIISFFGHSHIYDNGDLFEQVKKALLDHIDGNEKIWCYCGGYGDFDKLCSAVCRCVKEEHQNLETVFVTPYLTVSQQKKISYLMDAKLYDSSVYPPLEGVPSRFAIRRRNEWMVAEADLIIAYVDRTNGGAYQALRYAEKRKKRILNLAEEKK